MEHFDNHFLFSETYIKDYIKEKKKAANEVIESKFTQIKEWNDEYILGESLDDPWFDYIDAVLDVLGFQKEIKEHVRILYADIINEKEKPVAICYTIDKDEDVSSAKKGKYYAYNAISAAKRYDVDWAILTNGNKWRIYDTKNVSPYENYLEIDIEESIHDNKEPDDAFYLFYLFFDVNTYYTEDGELVIGKIKDSSDTKAEIIEETLRGKAEEILKELCYGLKENMGKETFTEEERKSIYNDAIILLYRLLFFGYAESRKLLPITDNDPEYTYSFFELCQDAKDKHNNGEIINIKDGFDFWINLDSRLRMYVDRSYNGGLFHNEDKPILKENRIANGRLAKCLTELTYNLDRKGLYTERIEYKDLSIRNLGSIYEGLLEYQLFIADERMVQRKLKNKVQYIKAADITLKNADLKSIIEKGEIYLSQDAIERKETGAYYTPEDVVQYIVDNTVGKKLEELKKELVEQKKGVLAQLSYEPLESRRRVLQNQIDELTWRFIEEKILRLSIIDSAMGSGHFLVNATYRVANEIVEIIAESDWESNEDLIVDIQYWKRKVVENCIYGIDINGLSVALARLSLWLISASNDKALSFIDHHLKEGNSIIGTDKKHVEIKEHSLFGVSYEDYMRPVLGKYEELRKVGSDTKKDVLEQVKIFNEINGLLELTKKKYHYYLASQYAGGIDNYTKYGNLLRSNNFNDFDNYEMEPLWKTAGGNKFFHWELEFPEVFLKGGFDVAIGNPPYVQVANTEYRYSIFNTIDTNNLYSYMIENSLYKLNPSGRYGFIIPISSISGSKFSAFQQFTIDISSELYIDSYAKRPCKIFNKVEQRLVIIHGVRKNNNDNCVLYTSGHKRWYSNERKDLFKPSKYTRCKFYVLRKGTIPKISNEIENDIIEKLFINNKGDRIEDYYTDNKKNLSNFLVYHSTSGYWLKALDYMPDFFSERKGNVPSTKYKYLCFKKNIEPAVFICLLNSSLFYWYWILFSDERDLTRREIDEFPIKYNSITENHIVQLHKLCNELMESYIVNAVKKTVNLGNNIGGVTFNEYHPKYSKTIINKIDDILGLIYGFTEEEVNFIKNYDIRFRMGDEYSEEDE